jgi:universal stress protein E
MIEPDRFPLSTVLTASDLSDEALRALRVAGQLLAAESTVLHAVHCAMGAPSDSSEADMASARGERELEERLRAHVGEATPLASEVRYHVVRDNAPHRVITRLGETLGADLLVLGSHRPRRRLDGLLGSTADRVLRTSSRPCLVVNAELQSAPRRLLVATDLSPTADRALRVAVSWGQQWARMGDAPSVVHVELLHVAAFAHPAYTPGGYCDRLQQRAREAEALSDGSVTVRPLIISAPLAAEGIQRGAEQFGADLTFLGTHGLSPIVRMLLGSVSSEVIRTMPLNAVVVPPSPEQ